MIPILALLLAANPIALKAARMFDARTGVVVQPGLVLVEGQRIARVGGAVPPGAGRGPRRRDAPAWPDRRAHARHVRGGRELVPRQPGSLAALADGAGAVRGRVCARTLEAGFTTIRDLGAYDSLDLGLSKAIEAGAVRGRA